MTVSPQKQGLFSLSPRPIHSSAEYRSPIAPFATLCAVTNLLRISANVSEHFSTSLFHLWYQLVLLAFIDFFP